MRSETIVKKSIGLVAAISVAAAAALTAIGTATPAHAAGCTAFPDPSGKTINGWGSQTMQDVYGGLTNGYTFSGRTYSVDAFGKTVGSWNSIDPNPPCAIGDSVAPFGFGGDTFQRPAGTGDGLAALSAAWGARNTWLSCAGGGLNTLKSPDKTEEITFARATALPSQADWKQANPNDNNLEFIPEAIDAVGVAEQVNGTIGTSDNKVDNFTTATLTNLYNDTAYTQGAPGSHTAGDVIITGGYPFLVTSVTRTGFTDSQVIPVLPEKCSGVRSNFLGAIGATTYDQAVVAEENGPARQMVNNASADLSVTDVNAALALNTPSYTVPTTAPSIEIVPFSGAQLIEQNHGITGNTTLGSFFPTINGHSLSTGTGTGAGIGTLQTAQAPQVTFGQSVVGDFAYYAWGVIPTSGSPAGLQTWLGTTLPAQTQVWDDFGYDPVGSVFSSNSSNWIITSWLN
jgi:hypothetical protein